MAYPNLTVTGSTLELDLRASTITGLSDAEAVTTQWVDAVASQASAVDDGGPTYTADAINGWPAVTFDASNGDILKWPLGYFDDCIVIVAGIWTDITAQQCTVAMEDSGNQTGNRNLFKYRVSGGDQHGMFMSGAGGGSAVANSSSSAYGSLAVFAIRFRNGTVFHYYKSGGTYAKQEEDNYVSASLENFDEVFVGGDPAASGGSGTDNTEGDILDVKIYHADNNATNDGTIDSEVAAIMQGLEDYYNGTGSLSPGTPTLSVDQIRDTSVDLSTDAFMPGQGGTQSAAQWQIATDSGFTSLVYNPGDDTVNLKSIKQAGSLSVDTLYYARMRKKETPSDQYSAWSNTVSFTTVSQGLRYVAAARGDIIAVAAEFVKTLTADETSLVVQVLRHDDDKALLGSPVTALQWLSATADGRKQSNFKVGGGLTDAQRDLLRWISFRFLPAVGSVGGGSKRSGLNWIDAWRNPPDYGLTASLSHDGFNRIDMEVESIIDARYKYVANTTGYVGSQTVEDSGTFTKATEDTSDTEPNVLGAVLAEGATCYVTVVPYDEDGWRSGPRYLVPTIVGVATIENIMLMETGDSLLLETGDAILLE